MEEKELYIKNLMATAHNLVEVIENKRWEVLEKKTARVKAAIELLKKELKIEFSYEQDENNSSNNQTPI